MPFEKCTKVREQIELHKSLALVYVKKRYAPAFSKIYHEYWNERMCQISKLKSGVRVLDLGCGTGILFPALVKKKYCVTGLDLSYEMLSAGRNDGLHIARICADGSHIPLADNTFDAVFCRGSIHHMPDLVTCFSEISRILINGGQLIFSEPCDDSILNRWARTIMYSKSNEFHEKDKGFRRRNIIALFRQFGFDIIYSRGFGFFGYIFAAFPDKISIMNKIPGNCFITRLLISLDHLIGKLPFLEIMALHWMVNARKL